MKKLILLFLVFMILAAMLPGCLEQKTVTTSPSIVMDKPYIGFSATHADKLNLDDFNQVDEGVFDTYAHRYGDYCSQVYYNNLGEADRRIYRILQYAMDYAYPCILIDSRMMVGMEYTVDDILTFFSLDSAVVGQNLSWQFGEFAVTYTYGAQVTELRGTRLYIHEFSPQKQAKKDEAIAVAEQILSQLPDGGDEEKARAIYTWLGENVEYYLDSQRDDDATYLHDALVGRKTNCDGFANAFSLLCAMEGIRCAEKIYVPGNGTAGHTWNVVELSGVWYNVDATASREVLEQDQPETYLHFGMADRYQEYICKFENLLPTCDNNLFPPYCHIGKQEDAPALVKEGFDRMQQSYLVVVAETGALPQNILEEIAKELGSSISTRHYILADGSAIYCIYKR